jgi:hypothetical protein
LRERKARHLDGLLKLSSQFRRLSGFHLTKFSVSQPVFGGEKASRSARETVISFPKLGGASVSPRTLRGFVAAFRVCRAESSPAHGFSLPQGSEIEDPSILPANSIQTKKKVVQR